MKIGFFSPYLDTFGGGERYMLALASHLAINNKVDVFWPDVQIKAPLSRFLKIDLTNINFTPSPFEKKLLPRLFSTFSYNLIFIISDGSVPLTFARKNILHFQVPFNFEKVSFKTNIALKRYKYVVVNSNFTKQYIDKTYRVNSSVIYPPVDIKNITPGQKENLILSVGRFGASQLHPKKQEILIEVFREFSKQLKNWKLVLAGQAKKEDYKYLRTLRKLAKGFAIKIVESPSFDELKTFYSKAQIYWHATGYGEDEIKFPQKMEHFGISTVEASAAGAVPIVINRGGQKEIVTEGEDGFLWDTKVELYEKTLLLVKNPNQLKLMSTQAVKNSKRFSQENFYRSYEKIIL